jgi:hypothetical protein
MLAILVLVALAIVAMCIIGAVLHLLFSPLLLVAIGILLFIKFRPHRTHQ